MKLISTTLALALASAALVLAAEFPKVGAPAPDVKLKNQEAKEVHLADLKGKWVVLYFYPKDFTSGCTLEAHNFQRDLEEYKKRNAAIVGVSVDSADSHKQFCTKESLQFELLSDPDASVSAAYNSLMDYNGKKMSSRNTFLIDPKGNVVKVFAAVKPAAHSEEVLAAIDEELKKAK